MGERSSLKNSIGIGTPEGPAYKKTQEGRRNGRCSPHSVAHWVPHFVRLGRIAAHHRVLDIGCATGGFTLALQTQTSALIRGYDISRSLLHFAQHKPGGHALDWIQGDSIHVSFAHQVFDRVIMSMCLHQIDNRAQAIREAYRVLRHTGLLLTRTIAPEDVARWVPFRFFSRVAALEASRFPPLKDLQTFWQMPVLLMCAQTSLCAMRTSMWTCPQGHSETTSFRRSRVGNDRVISS